MTLDTFENPSLHYSIYVIFYHHHSCEKRKKTAIFSFVTPHDGRNFFKNSFYPRLFVQANTFTFHILLYLREQCMSEKEVMK